VSYTLPAGAVATLKWAGYTGNTFDVTAGPGSRTIAPGGSTAFEVGVDHYGSNHAPVALQVRACLRGRWRPRAHPVYDRMGPRHQLGAEPDQRCVPNHYPRDARCSRSDFNSATERRRTGGALRGNAVDVAGQVQAENFDNGGNYIGYFNLDPSDPSVIPIEPRIGWGRTNH